MFRNSKSVIISFLVILISFTSCESAAEKKERLERKNEQQIELAEVRAEKEREKAILEKYLQNSLFTGATPYEYCFGSNSSCKSYGCSQIKVKSPLDSDVLVTIKQNDDVIRHAYIKAGSSYTFELLDGTYQPFFYYGKGWNPEKVMKETDCGTLKGGFVAEEHFGKDSPQNLQNGILQYELILQSNGNFSTQASNSQEAF